MKTRPSIAAKLRMTPQIDAYTPDMVGYAAKTPQQARAYYPAVNLLRSMNQSGAGPSTDSEIYQFMQRYADAANRGDGTSAKPYDMRMSENSPGDYQFMDETDPQFDAANPDLVPVVSFMRDIYDIRDMLPEPLQLKLDRAMQSVKNLGLGQ